MDDLIDRIATQANIEHDLAEQAAGQIFALLRQHGEPNETAAMMAAIPGADALADKFPPEAGGFLTRLGGPALAAYAQMSALGLDGDQIEVVGRAILTHAKQKAGEDTVEAAIRSVPGLGQYL